jgi:fibronectin type 3 domain-containing protein
MATRHRMPHSVVGPAGFLIGLILLVSPIGSLEASTLIRLAWDTNTEQDLAGYRIHYGTSSGRYTLPFIDVQGTTSASIQNLQATTTYYFVVTAYDNAGNESSPSNEVAVQPTVIVSVPTVTGATETGTGTVDILQSGHQDIQVSGTNFQGGATVSLGADITVGPTSLIDSGHLTASIVVSPSALLGPRALALTNPDGGAASKSGALTVVKTADIDRDCKIDLFDLNLLARAWNTSSSDAAYIVEADLDGDGNVGGLDLQILVTYLGQRLEVCP